MDRTVVVVGAGLGGLRAAEQLRAAGWDEGVVVIGAESHLPYNRPPLTKQALVTGIDRDALTFRRRASVSDVAWRLGTTVTAADLGTRTLTLDDGTAVPYDGLVVATGVRSRRLGLAAPLAARHAVRTIEDAEALRPLLREGARLVIVGSGFIGCEVAAAGVALGCAVTVVEPLATPLLGVLGAEVGSELQRRHEEHGVRFRLGRSVTSLRTDPDGTHEVLLDDGTWLVADVVVEAVGSLANTGWLAGNGLDLRDGVLCDVDLHPVTARGPVPTVVAVGDVARFPQPSYDGAPHRIEHWTMPTDTAGHAARSLVAGIDGTPVQGPAFAPLPSFWSDQYGVRVQSFGIPSLGLGDVRVLDGELREEAVVGFHRDGTPVGVVLIGMGRQMLERRTALAEALAAVSSSPSTTR